MMNTNRSKIGLFLLSLLWMSASSLHAAPLERWQSPGYLLQSFIEIAMFNEYSERPAGIRKWTGPIHYYVEHRVGDQDLHEQLTRLHIEQLAEITGLDMRPAPSRESANVLIIFSTEAQLQDDLLYDFEIRSPQLRKNLFRSSVCLGDFFMTRDASIKRAVVIIPVDRASEHAKLVDCIVEEITQILGLPNDSERVFPSVFNDKSVNSLLSGLDYLMLKMLYDSRVKAGMSIQQALPVLRTIAEEYERDEMIETAEAQVRMGKLYELLY